MEMDQQRISGLTKVGFGVLACNSLAICKSWGDAASVAFVLIADAALVLLFACLRELERRRRDGGAAAAGSGRIKAAVWALTTLLTAMLGYASGVASLMPPVVSAFFFLICLGEADWAQIGIDGPYAELVRIGFGVVACNSALASHHVHARGDVGSLASVFVAYAGFVTAAWLLLRRFGGRGRGVEQ